MSRIGKKPILIPEGVNVKIDKQEVIIKGPKGELSQKIPFEIKVEIKDNRIFVQPFVQNDKKIFRRNKKTKALWGLIRSLLNNNIKGVTEGHEKKLEIEGIGYQASLKENDLILQVGFTHPVKIKMRPDIKFSVDKNVITISGINKELVGQIAAKIRKVKPPEPYKGKGIRYFGETIKKKAGKKVVTTE